MISDTQRCLLSCVSATRRSMWGCSRGTKASVKLRNNPWKEEDREFFFFPTWSAICISTPTPTNLTLNKQNLRGLNLSLPLRSSRERNSMNWLMKTGSEKWSKMIFSRCWDRNVKMISCLMGHSITRLLWLGTYLCHFLSGQALFGLLLQGCIHQQFSKLRQ